MTIRLTTPDERGETPAGQRAYNERREFLRREGIAVIPDLYGADKAESIYDVPDPETVQAENERAFAAELGALERADNAAQEERKSDLAGDDLSWMWEGSDVELRH